MEIWFGDYPSLPLQPRTSHHVCLGDIWSWVSRRPCQEICLTACLVVGTLPVLIGSRWLLEIATPLPGEGSLRRANSSNICMARVSFHQNPDISSVQLHDSMASPQQVHLREHPECFPYHPDIPTPFGYRPSLAAGITFTIVFMGLFVAHAWQTIRNRNLWLGAAFSLGAFGEFTGWLGRAVAYRCPYSVKLLEMQLASLVMGE